MFKLSTSAIKKLEPHQQTYKKFENNTARGVGTLGIKVYPSGRKTFIFRYFLGDGKKTRLMTLGDITMMSLAQARQEARQLSLLVSQGKDPKAMYEHEQSEKVRVEAERLAKQKEEEQRGSLRQLVDYYVTTMKKEGKRTYDRVQAALERDLFSVLSPEMKAREVTSLDIKKVLSPMVQRKAPIEANRVRSYLHRAFKLGLQHDNDPSTLESEVLFAIENNPVTNVPKQAGDGNVRNRFLTVDELRELISSLDGQGFSVSTKYLILLMIYSGGQRPYEIINSQWSNIDIEAGDWIIPPTLAKNKKTHLIPLTEQMKTILRSLKVLASSSPYTFPSSRDANKPGRTDSLAQSFSRYCKRNEIAEAITPRDIRTTCKTLMTKHRISSKEVLDRLQHHSLNDISTKHYNMHDYRDEKLEALVLWNDWLEELVGPVKGFAEQR
ncbi:tyrosine-type recombinase/integrase [Idiomarina abyssalis]|uniref:tyrosine-type recombinase/integrase n=1 Tax=Idiomarina abyssalis TaxID=86102 RepID=UPI001CD646B2|nr:site-specific integrase [Idiomarina abyssalis]